MSIRLTVDTKAWRRHLSATAATVPGLVPVAKGNGYGFGIDVLASEATRLGADTLAVGRSHEVRTAREAGFQGDIVVLTSWRHFEPRDVDVLTDPGVIVTLGSVDDIKRLTDMCPGARVLLEVETSMRRHGLDPAELRRAVSLLDGLTLLGWTIHLPMTGNASTEASSLAALALDALPGTLWLSHVSPADAGVLAEQFGVDVRLRMGTPLWLHSPALTTDAAVLDVHQVSAGERVGYWQHRVPMAGWVVVVSGGTANGVALSAPSSGASLKRRAITAAEGLLDASGVARSPYTIAGRKRIFVEPPHMQESLVFVPGAACPVAIGDRVPVELRLTTATVDEIDFR